MIRKMQIELVYTGGGKIEKLLTYEGDTLEQIAAAIERDENDLLRYMQTGETDGVRSFCFRGFMFRKDGLAVAQMQEPEF